MRIKKKGKNIFLGNFSSNFIQMTGAIFATGHVGKRKTGIDSLLRRHFRPRVFYGYPSMMISYLSDWPNHHGLDLTTTKLT